MAKPQLKNQLRYYFSHNALARGQEYFYDDLVDEVEVSDFGAIGWVHGSDSYKVSLDWRNGPIGEVFSHCSCPHFAGGNFCKHLWAFIMALDSSRDVNLKLPRGINLELKFAVNQRSVDAPAAPIRGSANWREAFSAKPALSASRGDTRTQDIFLVLEKDLHDPQAVRVRFFASNKLVDGSFGGARPFILPPNGDVRSAEPKMQAALRAIAMISLGEMNFHRGHGYGYTSDPTVRSMRIDSLKLILRDLLETSRVYAQKEDYQKEQETKTILSLRYAKFSALKLSVSEHIDGHALTGQIQSSAATFEGSDELIANVQELKLVSQSLFRHGRDIGILELSDAEKPWFEELSQGSLLVPKGDEEPFLEAILNQQMSFELPEALRWQEEPLKPSARVELKLDKNEDRSKYLVDLKFEYGSRVISYWQPQSKIPSEEDKRVYLRDQTEESRVLSLLPINLLETRQNDNASLLRAQNLVEFVKDVIGQGVPVTVENKKIESEASFDFSVSSGVDWFDVEGQASFAGKWIKFPAILEAVSKGEHFVPLADGSLGMISEQIAKRLERLAAFAQKNGDGLRFTSAQGILLSSLLEDEASVDIDAKFAELRRKIKRFAGIEAVDPVPSFQGKLRKYQREGLGWLEFLEDFGLGGILADDMGLGKTIQCLAFLEKRRVRSKNRSPSLLVAPKSLLGNWKNEAERFTPDLRVLIYAGTSRHDLGSSQFIEFDLVVTTYQTMLRDFDTLRDREWDCLITDEAQAIKNPEALVSKAIKTIPAKFRLAMTGTPIENSIQDLFSISDFVNPGFLNGKKQSSGLKVTDEAREVLSKAFKPVVLRRTKDQVLKDLPEKIEQMISVELEPKQQKIYNELKRFYQSQLLKEVEEKGIKKSQIQILAALTRLRQVALHPGLISDDHAKIKSSKFEVVLDMLEEIIGEDHRVLVFSQFTSLLALLKRELKARKIDFCYLDGQTNKRQETVDSFKKSAVPVFLMSLKAGGVGLNLVEADYVFLLDPWWNPAVEAQAIDRVHRIGQKKSVNAYRFIAKNTVEEKILELQNTKRGLSADILGQKSSPLKSLTAKDIAHIFS